MFAFDNKTRDITFEVAIIQFLQILFNTAGQRAIRRYSDIDHERYYSRLQCLLSRNSFRPFGAGVANGLHT